MARETMDTMHHLKDSFTNPASRRQLLTTSSGALLLAALVAGKLLDRPALASSLMVAAALIAGSDIATRALQALRHRQISIELLVTIATAGALAIGEYWEAAAVTFLFMLGAYLEARTLNRTRRALRELIDLAPTTAIVVRDGEQRTIPATEVEVGETVVVKPGGRVPVDGRVLTGHAAVDESPITGESMPVEKSAEDGVFAGTISVDGVLRVQATGVAADTTLARIIRRVEEAQEAQAPTQRFIERFSRWYTPAIIGLSALSWLVTRDVELALTLLVIGCPGALVISTPVSVVAGIGRAARAGILIKGGEYLENAGRISAVAFDKTGTLTQGRPTLTDIVPLQPALTAAGPARAGFSPAAGARASAWTPDQREILRWAAIAEADSEHPLARPIVTAAAADGAAVHADTFTVHPGRGVSAGYQGHTIAVGSPGLMDQLGIAVDDQASRQLGRLKTQGKTAVVVALDGVPLGVLGVADPMRPASPEMIRRLRRAGIGRIVMLTGDDRRTATAIAAAAGIVEVYAELLPEQKLEAIRRLRAEGHVVAMVGDGINDAPALAAADIGIAMGAAGTDVAIETADIALASDDLMKVPDAIALSKATMRNIRQNVAVALVTVGVLLAGVLAGEIHMAAGMLVHEVSVLVVILNGMRLLGRPGTRGRSPAAETLAV
jgi:Cd2+/Zn2+-exporting ATPase